MQAEKFSYFKVFLLGFGFFGISVIWSVYNSYVPVFLKELGLASWLVGFIMTIDNIFAVVLLPYLGVLSDVTRTRIGRRKPYILLGAPPAALTFALIPFFRAELLPMMAVIVVMNLSMALFRSPVIAFMPDITPSEKRSQANGIINFMGGVGSLLAYFVGSLLYKMNPTYPFVASGVILLLASLLVILLVDEPEEFKVKEAGGPSFTEVLRKTFRQSFRELADNLKLAFTDPDKSLLFMLSSIFLWFIGYNAIETFFTSYAKWYMGLDEATGSFILGFVALGFLIFSLPAGFIGAKLGRRRTMTLGLLLLVSLLAGVHLAALSITGSVLVYTVEALFFLGGFAWALVNVNSLPTVVDMTTREKLGAYTGLYYFASQSAAILAPPIAGLFIDLLGYPTLMPYSIAFLLLSAVTLQFVRKGEARKGF
ncbi:MFS transporter [Infirmifilum sp. NZ]|uniref:MFS transporter n=1 Tax=Infirmifilum sp. NZ TaxID=2926850 RepID=UPI00279B63AE|nr:MFS transporter [Infirmifilum sp. NZ]UNQ73472.1 MFS transporter [Infirmifilum sp. NZ]